MKKFLLVLLTIGVSLILVACGNKNVQPASDGNSVTSIVGYWKNDDFLPGTEFIYSFNEDGTGNYNVSGSDMPFKYVLNGKKISIFYDGNDVPFETDFEIKDNILNVKDSIGNDTLYKRVSESEAKTVVNVPKSEQTGTAGSNIPLKDNQTEAENQIKIAFQKWLEETYGDNIVDARINVGKVFTAEDEQENEALKSYNLGIDEIAFEVNYELKPAEGADINMLTVATGEYDEESGWITDKFNLGILRPSTSGDGEYIVTDIGTGW